MGVEGVAMLRRTAAILVLAAGVAAAEGEPAGNAAASKALGPAISVTIERFNRDEDVLRETPRVERVGPERDPQMLRATYRRAAGKHQVVGTPTGVGSEVTVRVRASEYEKRATNVNAGNLERDFADAPWRETPRGYMLDFRLRWTGTEWEQVGEPVAHPVLGFVGQ